MADDNGRANRGYSQFPGLNNRRGGDFRRVCASSTSSPGNIRWTETAVVDMAAAVESVVSKIKPGTATNSWNLDLIPKATNKVFLITGGTQGYAFVDVDIESVLVFRWRC
jgi:hypothetical protein